MSQKLFVGGLSWGTSEEELRRAFEQYGEVSEVKIITDRDTGRSRGFGFITFENAEECKNAMQQMDGSSLDGRTLRVNEANDRGSDRGSNRGGGYGAGRRW